MTCINKSLDSSIGKEQVEDMSCLWPIWAENCPNLKVSHFLLLDWTLEFP